MKTFRFQEVGAVLTVALIGVLAGCDSLNLDKMSTTAGLTGKKTFTEATIYGTGMVSGAGGEATAAAAQEIRDIFVQQGYVYEAGGPADFQVVASWLYNRSANPFSTQTQMNTPTAMPTHMQQITMSILVRDPTGNDILWRGVTPLPITAVTLTPDGAVMLVKDALRNLPEATAAASKP